MSSIARLLHHRHALAWALACALLLAQALGLAHGVRHAPGLAAVAMAAQVDPAAAQDADASHGDHRAGDAECRLLDQLAHADALTVPPLVLPPAPPTVAVAAPGVPSPAAADAAAYRARAPPRG